MKRLLVCFWAVICSVAPAHASTKVMVTVVDPKSGRPIQGLKTEDFTLLDDKTPRRIEGADLTSTNLDVILLLDTSLAGGMVQPFAENLVAQLQPKDQMAVVAFHSSADLIQDFTSSREILLRSISKVKYGNNPHMLDGLYATIDGAFQNTGFRRAVLLLTAGVEGNSRVKESEVIRLARRNGVSIFVVYMIGFERSMFENLARQTGGASFRVKDMRKMAEGAPGARIFTLLRSYYTLTVSGNLGLGDKVKVEVKGADKPFISALPLE